MRSKIFHTHLESSNDTSEVVPNVAVGQAAYQRKRKASSINYADFGDLEYRCEHCGALYWFNERLARSRKTMPIFGLCCSHGDVNLPPPRTTPCVLDTLLDTNGSLLSKHFRENIRAYNSMFAFTSMGAKIDNSVNIRPGPYVFKIGGQCHHLMGSLIPTEGEVPRFAQFYTYDTQHEISNRLHPFTSNEGIHGLNEEIVRQIKDMLDENNEIVRLFRVARDRLSNDPSMHCRLRIIGKRHETNRQYDAPSSEDIGGLIVGDIGDYSSERDIIIESHSQQLQRISKLHPKFMALQYPLLFPYGEDGYHCDIRLIDRSTGQQSRRRRVSMCEYYTYMLHERDTGDSNVLKGGRLLQQFLVDAFVTVEEDRLDYIRTHQSNLRSDHYQAIEAAVLKGDTESAMTGKVVVPSSFTGGVRYMINNYQDAMAICRAHGNPDLFITFTCNVGWPEIQRALQRGRNYRPEDKPHLISRIFKAKLADMLLYIKSGKPFGKVVADVCAIEFQKRGLPHSHLLVWLSQSFKCYLPADIDSIISAEIPDKDMDPHCYDIVKQFMVHGPCGIVNTNSPCMKDSRCCSKGFPKKYQPNTMLGENGFMCYKRRNDPTRYILKNNIKVDNVFIVPYNRELLLRYKAHINVEICCQSKLIKYLFKYINKGTDRARVVIENQSINEIQAYLNCRYVCPYEAAWRLYQFPIHSHNPSVQRLQIHLPKQQNIVFPESATLHSVLNRPQIDKTMLTEWFECNKNIGEAQSLYYTDFPSHFVWNKMSKAWSQRLRKKGTELGRIAYVHPAAGELYYLRLLLNHVKGATSFKDLRTVNNTVHPTFQSACDAHGLLGDDKEWADALEEASITASSSQIRQLFVSMLLFCNIANPMDLFQVYCKFMYDDIERNLRQAFALPGVQFSENHLKNYVLYELEQLLNASSTSLLNYHLPMPSGQLLEELRNKLLQEELNYNVTDLKAKHADYVSKLNQEQRHVYDIVVDVVLSKQTGLFFVQGHGGTGKTFLWHTIINRIRSEGLIVLAVASSGIASLLLPNGRTAHSRFKIPIDVNKDSTCEIKKNTQLSHLISTTSLVVWDEAPMNNRCCFEALDRTMKDILRGKSMNSQEQPFGGVPILLGGDFRQILPVIPCGSREDIVRASLSSSPLWSKFVVFSLKQNMRLLSEGLSEEQKKEIAEFANWLLNIGNGEISDLSNPCDEDASYVKIPPEYLLSVDKNPIQAMVENVYPNIGLAVKHDDYYRERAIVATKNAMVNTINNYSLNMLPTEKCTYTSHDSVDNIPSLDTNNSDLIYTPEFLNQLEFNGVPSHVLHLKLETPIMLLRNLNPSIGLCNGTRLIVTQLANKVIEARIITGNNIGSKVFIPRIVFIVKDPRWPFVFKRRQFPVRPCFAMTINKSQGQSLKIVGIFLDSQVFTHGQLYVALSRVTSKEGLKIITYTDGETPGEYAKNIVYKDVLSAIPK